MSRGPARILLVTHSLSGGGAERFVATLAARLDRRRFAPAVVAATPQATYPVPDDVPVTRLGYRGVLTLPRTIARLRRAIADSAPDLVLSNVLSTNCLTGAALAGRGGRSGQAGRAGEGAAPRWIARVANSPEHGDPWLQRLWGRRVYPRADLVVANSEGLEKAFVRYYPGASGGSGPRVRALPNPTDFEALEQRAAQRWAGRFDRIDRSSGERPDGVLRLLWIGRLEPQKRPDLALEVMERLRREGSEPAVRLLMCGDGSLRGRLARQVAARGLGAAVELAGFIENPSAAMADADLFLSTSDFEGLPNALIEAQGLGLPAVATRCPFGPDEIVDDGATGRLVPVGDAEALASAVAALARDPERRRRMAEAARRRARERFGVESVVPRWEAALDEVLGRPVAPTLTIQGIDRIGTADGAAGGEDG